MSRAGREPAEDMKRRLAAACEEVGLTIIEARMILLKDRGVRIVYVGAASPGWEHECPMLSVMANVNMTGERPESVDVRCIATDERPEMVAGPWMKGRNKVLFPRLIEQLIETLEERKEVMRRLRSGMRSPFKFERSVWHEFNPLDNLPDGKDFS